MGHGIDYRDYQVDARDAAFAEFDKGIESTLLVLPTGTGKTVLAGMCVEEQLQRGGKTLFMAHREVLIEQAYKTLSKFGFNTAIEMGVNDARKSAAVLGAHDVVVGSVQSLQGDRLMRWHPESFSQIIVDEAHRSLADQYTKTLNWFQGYNLLGITATPERGDARNLGSRYKTKAYEYRLRQAIKDGWIVQIRTRECQVNIDLRGVSTIGGDLSLGEVAERVGPKIEELARAFIAEIGDRQAVNFLPDVGSAMFFADVCNALGVKACYVAGEGGRFGMSKEERKAALKAYSNKEYQIVACCELLIEGWDCPETSAVGITRATLQSYRYRQMVGRGTRPHPESGKKDCLVIDFDWTTDKECKDLCSVVSLFDDGSLDDEVVTVANEIVKASKGKEINSEEVIEEAEKIIRTRDRFMVRLTGKSAEFKTITYDPVGVSKVLDIKLNRKYDLDKKGVNPATGPQLRMLKSLGIEAPDGLSKWGASKMIDKLVKRKKQGLASALQVGDLLSHGVSPDLARSMDEKAAREAIREIRAIRPEAQRMLF